jgi:hypothetical protein
MLTTAPLMNETRSEASAPSGASINIEGACRVAAVLSSAGLDLAAIVVYRHANSLPSRRRLFLLRRAQAQVVQDAPDGQRVGDVGHDLEWSSVPEVRAREVLGASFRSVSEQRSVRVRVNEAR